MNYNYDLTIIVPGIRNKYWSRLFEQARNACKRYSYEIIFSGPFSLPSALQNEKNVKYIKNYGSPTRALHLGTLIAEGRFFTWLVDDAHVKPDSIDGAIDLLLENHPDKDLLGIRYTEGECHSGAEFSEAYWTAGFHEDLRAPGVNPAWRTSVVLLMALSRYQELGGIDHGFEHINMNIHDLAFRAQKDGSFVHLSPMQVMNCDWSANCSRDNSPIFTAFFDNDRPLFWELYKDDSRPIVIDPENWRLSCPIWPRRYGSPQKKVNKLVASLQTAARRTKTRAKKLVKKMLKMEPVRY